MLSDQELKKTVDDLLDQQTTIIEQMQKTIKCSVIIREKVLSGFNVLGQSVFKKKAKTRTFYGLSYAEIKAKIFQHLKEIKYE